MATNEYQLDIEGLGNITVLRQTMALRIAVEAEYSRLTEGLLKPSPDLAITSRCVAMIKKLVAKAPDGFDVMELDPLEDASYSLMVKIANAITDKEQAFRGRRPEAQDKTAKP